MEFRVLGPVGARVGDEPLAMGGTKQRTVLALLVAYAGRPVSVGQLIEGVYGDDATDGAKRTIHTYVSNLRREVGDAIVASGDGYVLDPDLADIDATRFEVLFRDGAALVESSPEEAAALLREALALWRGHPYVDVETHGVLDPEIVRLDAGRLAALEARIDAELALGLHRELLGELEALTAEYPFREGLRAQQMVALYRSGRQSEALRAFTRTRELLGEELGIDPSPELQALEEQILLQDPALDVPGRASIERRAVLAAEMDERLRYAPAHELDAALGRRNRLLQEKAAATGGAVLDVRGTAVYAAFKSVTRAVDAARALVDTSVQIAIDYGNVEIRDEVASGPPVTMALRLAAVGHPGQVLLSADAQAELATDGTGGWSVAALGQQPIRGLDRPIQVFQLVGEGLAGDFSALRLDRLPPPLPTAFPGSVAGYELREELGGGVTGVVHRAYQSSVGREVVVRVIRPELVADPRFVRRFEAEAQRAAAIEHPHVVPLLDYWRAPSQAFLVHRLVRGAALDVEATENPRDASLLWLGQIAAGLAAGHARGVAHGRIRPENVLIDDGYAFVADLGVAAMFEGMVTPPADVYTAPEAIGGAVSVAADVYALGALAAELVAGEREPPDGRIPGLDAAMDAVIERATHRDPERRFQSVTEFVDALVVSAGAAPAPVLGVRRELRNPFKGLAAFQESDAVDFFGRGELVDTLMQSVTARSFTLVAGPSGIGKSSVVRAGLVPAVRAGGWMVTDMFPGARPFDGLQTALERIAVRPIGNHIEALRSGNSTLAAVVAELVPADAPVLVVVDQFEELFTHTADEDARRRFLDVLTELGRIPPSSLRVVATIRADFLDRPLLYAEFGRLVGSSTVTVSAPTSVELADIVGAPPASVGLEVEPALAEALVADADRQPGALPLLQYTMTELFSQRETDALTLDAYRSAGGLRGAVGRRADSIFESLSEPEGAIAREVFLRLVTVDEDAQPIRRRVQRTELDDLGTGGGSVGRVLDAFGRHRLVVFDRDPTTRAPTVEIAHDALVTEWARLGDWIDDARDDLVTTRRLESVAHEWSTAGSDPSYLVRGGQLDRALTWRTQSGLKPSPTVDAFVDASLEREEQESADRQTRRRRILGGFAAAAVVALLLAVVAWVQRGAARTEARLAAARELVLEADRNLEIDPELSVHLALRAIESFDRAGDVPGSAVTTLRRALAADRVVTRLPGGVIASVSRDGAMLATEGEGGGIALWEIDSGQHVETIDSVGDAAADGAAFSQSANELFVSFTDGDEAFMSGLDLDTREWSEIPGTRQPAGAVWTFDSSPDGRWWLVGLESQVEVWDRASGERVFEADAVPGPMSVSNGGLLAYGEPPPDGVDWPVVLIVDVESGAEVLRVDGTEVPYWWATFSPDGDQVALASFEGHLSLRDLSDGRELWAAVHSGVSWRPVWLPGGDRLLVGGEGRPDIDIIEATTGSLVARVLAHTGGSLAYAGVPGTSNAVSAGMADGAALVFDASDGGPDELGEIETPFGRSELAVTGEHLLLWDDNEGRHLVVDVATGAVVSEAAGGARAVADARFYVVTGGPQDRLVTFAEGADVYAAPQGWSIGATSGDGSLAIIHRDAGDFDFDDPATRLVRVSNGDALFELEAGDISRAAFTSDGGYVVTNGVGGQTQRVRVWRVEDGERIAAFGGDEPDIPGGFHMELSPDDSLLVIGGEDGVVQLFDFPKILSGVDPAEAMIRAIQAHDNFVLQANVSSDGLLLVTTSFDERVKLWDIETGRLLSEFGTADFTPAAFHATEPLLYVAGGDSVAIHTLDLGLLIEIAESGLSREMTEEECDLYLRRACGA